MTRKDSKLKLQDLGLDLRLVSLDFGLDSGLACLDSGLDSGLEGKDLRLTYDLQNNDLVPPLFYTIKVIINRPVVKLFSRGLFVKRQTDRQTDRHR